MEQENLITLTADIVSAHVSNNSVTVGDIPALIENVHNALGGLGKPAEEAPTKPEPKVSVRSSVKPDAITCMLCGGKQKMLKRHLMTAHGLTPKEYRDTFSLNADYPMVAPNYSASRADLARKIGLGTKGRKPAVAGGDGKGAKPRRKKAAAPSQ